MYSKLHGLAIGVLLLATACSDSSQRSVVGEATTGDVVGEISLSVPSAITTARAVNTEALFARVVVNGDSTDLAIGVLTANISAIPGTILNLTISWFEVQTDGRELLLAEQTVSQLVTGSTTINVADYFTGNEQDGSVNERFDADGDGVSNLEELDSGRNPLGPGLLTVQPGQLNVTTAFDIIAASDIHTTLERLLIDTGLRELLDNPDMENQVTVFAPSNRAFEALPSQTLDNLPRDVLLRILNHHIIDGAVQSGDISAKLVPPASDFTLASFAVASPSQSLTFTASGPGISVTDGTGNEVLLNSTLNLNAPVEGENRTGIVHVINTVLMPIPTGGDRNVPNVRIPRIDAAQAPMIDGRYDPIWNDGAVFNDVNGESLSIDNLMLENGARRFNGSTEMRWLAMHDDSNLYVFVLGENVDAANVFRDSNRVFQDDSVALYIDGNNSKGFTYDGFDDRHLMIPLLTEPSLQTENSTFFENGSNSASEPSFEFATCQCDTDQHTWEFRLPFSEFNISKNVPFGFEVQIDLDHNGDLRDARWGWFHPARTTTNVDNTWRNPSFMGTAIVE
ncbi:MAG: fasciclin domain-containing protein [Granulosicoccus sp.]